MTTYCLRKQTSCLPQLFYLTLYISHFKQWTLPNIQTCSTEPIRSISWGMQHALNIICISAFAFNTLFWYAHSERIRACLMTGFQKYEHIKKKLLYSKNDQTQRRWSEALAYAITSVKLNSEVFIHHLSSIFITQTQYICATVQKKKAIQDNMFK